ncbi:MAG: phosphatidylserine decarboxylase family protein [Flavobacteriales bacterium]
MKINKEGTVIIIVSALIIAGLLALLNWLIPIKWIVLILAAMGVVLFGLIIWFFRMPPRTAIIDDNKIIAPSDGKVVIIEKVYEPEYFKDERIQVSIFMSPLNVHAQWYPINGKVKYYKYHPGKYLVAWHPKSSTLNERSTLVLENKKGQEILVRQIAGAVARRIVTYSKIGEECKQGDEFGFIKFGSRIDLFLPLDSKIITQLQDKVQGSLTTIAEF